MEFYEWRFTQSIPKETALHKQRPSLEVITQGGLIVSASLLDSEVETFNGKTRLKVNTNAPVTLEVGQIQTPFELIDKLNALTKKFNTGVEQFKQLCLSGRHFIDNQENPHLYKVSFGTISTAQIYNYGPFEAILKKLSSYEKSLEYKSQHKTGRAFELGDFKRLQNTMGFLDISVDHFRIAKMIELGNIDPQHKNDLSWEDCYVKLVSEANETKNFIDKYSSMQWVRATQSSLKDF